MVQKKTLVLKSSICILLALSRHCQVFVAFLGLKMKLYCSMSWRTGVNRDKIHNVHLVPHSCIYLGEHNLSMRGSFASNCEMIHWGFKRKKFACFWRNILSKGPVLLRKAVMDQNGFDSKSKMRLSYRMSHCQEGVTFEVIWTKFCTAVSIIVKYFALVRIMPSKFVPFNHSFSTVTHLPHNMHTIRMLRPSLSTVVLWTWHFLSSAWLFWGANDSRSLASLRRQALNERDILANRISELERNFFKSSTVPTRVKSKRNRPSFHTLENQYL